MNIKTNLSEELTFTRALLSFKSDFDLALDSTYNPEDMSNIPSGCKTEAYENPQLYQPPPQFHSTGCVFEWRKHKIFRAALLCAKA